MRKQYLYCLISILAILMGIIFTISAVILQSNPLSRRSALLIVSIILVLVGAVAFAVNYKKNRLVTSLIEHKVPIIAQWSYQPITSKTITLFVLEQQGGSKATALLFFILSGMFCLIFAYSGGIATLYTGYLLLLVCVCLLILSLRFISAYYEHLYKTEVDVIFGEDSIYFLDELYEIRRGYHCLQQVAIHYGDENCLLFHYGLYDVDDEPAYTLTIPIPANKLHTAEHLKDYYNDIIKPLAL